MINFGGGNFVEFPCFHHVSIKKDSPDSPDEPFVTGFEKNPNANDTHVLTLDVSNFLVQKNRHQNHASLPQGVHHSCTAEVGHSMNAIVHLVVNGIIYVYIYIYIAHVYVNIYIYTYVNKSTGIVFIFSC